MEKKTFAEVWACTRLLLVIEIDMVKASESQLCKGIKFGQFGLDLKKSYQIERKMVPKLKLGYSTPHRKDRNC